MLQSIYASKLYKTSKRKSRIKAAISNPLNSQLVTQVAKSLDEEYKTEDYLMTEEDKAAKAKGASAQSGQVSQQGDQGPGGSAGPDFGGSERGFSGGHGSGGNFSGGGDLGGDELKGDLGGLGGDDSGESLDTDKGSAPEPAKEPSPNANVKESTRIRGRRITASSDFKDIGEAANQIKGLLNFKDSTSGVNRTLVKENELWIYFNDDINLNNIMAIVIDTLNASGYTYLEFNRLARSDNAIVFEISFGSSDNQIKPKQDNEVEEPEVESESVVNEA